MLLLAALKVSGRPCSNCASREKYLCTRHLLSFLWMTLPDTSTPKPPASACCRLWAKKDLAQWQFFPKCATGASPPISANEMDVIKHGLWCYKEVCQLKNGCDKTWFAALQGSLPVEKPNRLVLSVFWQPPSWLLLCCSKVVHLGDAVLGEANIMCGLTHSGTVGYLSILPTLYKVVIATRKTGILLWLIAVQMIWLNLGGWWCVKGINMWQGLDFMIF